MSKSRLGTYYCLGERLLYISYMPSAIEIENSFPKTDNIRVFKDNPLEYEISNRPTSQIVPSFGYPGACVAIKSIAPIFEVIIASNVVDAAEEKQTSTYNTSLDINITNSYIYMPTSYLQFVNTACFEGKIYEIKKSTFACNLEKSTTPYVDKWIAQGTLFAKSEAVLKHYMQGRFFSLGRHHKKNAKKLLTELKEVKDEDTYTLHQTVQNHLTLFQKQAKSPTRGDYIAALKTIDHYISLNVMPSYLMQHLQNINVLAEMVLEYVGHPVSQITLEEKIKRNYTF